MSDRAVTVLFQSHLQAVLLDPEKLLSLARFLKDGGQISDLAKTIGVVLETMEALKAEKTVPPGPAPPGEPGARAWTWSPLRIPWKTTEGPKGPYEKAEDPMNMEFQELVKDLRAHQGSLTRDGLFYWLFTEGLGVGRKKAKP